VARTDVSPVGGRKFLGQFGTEAVMLTLGGLPAHRVVTVEFDLLVIRSWDGNAGGQIGPDQWRLEVVDGPELLHCTWSNWRTVVERIFQSYPDRFASYVHPSFSGADEEYTLGYQHGGSPMDSVYRIARTFSHADSMLQLRFAGLNLQDITDESWGWMMCGFTCGTWSRCDSCCPRQPMGCLPPGCWVWSIVIRLCCRSRAN